MVSLPPKLAAREIKIAAALGGAVVSGNIRALAVSKARTAAM